MTRVYRPAHSSTSTFGDRLLAELLPVLGESPRQSHSDLRDALVLAISVHDEALSSPSVAMDAVDQARLHELGRRWAVAQSPLDPLLAVLRQVTEHAINAAVSDSTAEGSAALSGLVGEIHETGDTIIRELLTGFTQARARDRPDFPDDHGRQLLATSLLWGLEVPSEFQGVIANGYAVVAVHWGEPTQDDLAGALVRRFEQCGGRDVLPLLSSNEGYLLVRAHDERHALSLCQNVHRQMSGPLWLAVSWRDRSDIPSGRREARSVLTLVRNSAEPAGVYRIENVLVEYAVMQDPSIMTSLLDLVTPVVRQPALHTTLTAFIDANGNRSKAAAVLRIHRSTLDYRLGRIEQLTGCQPTSARGIQMLATALTTYDAVHS